MCEVRVDTWNGSVICSLWCVFTHSLFSNPVSNQQNVDPSQTESVQDDRKKRKLLFQTSVTAVKFTETTSMLLGFFKVTKHGGVVGCILRGGKKSKFVKMFGVNLMKEVQVFPAETLK